MKTRVIDGVTYYDADEEMTHEAALKWAEENGLCLLTRGEWCDRWDSSEEFRKSCAREFWWTASVDSTTRPCYAWSFNGNYGNVYYNFRNVTYSVRCVKKETKR